MKTIAKAVFLLVLLSLGCSLAAFGDTEPGGLAAGLKRHYKLSTSTLGTNGYLHLVPGTVLTVLKEGIVSFTDEDASYVGLCSSDVQGGAIREPKSAICNRLAPPGRKILKVSETVCITALGVDENADTVSMSLTTCSRNTQSRRTATYHALLRFRFPHGALAATSADDVVSVIGQALSEGGSAPPPPASAGSNESGMAPIPPPPAPEDGAVQGTGQDKNQPPAQDGKPASTRVAKGQSPDQVIAILGQPTSIADLGPKLIYYYPNLKIVFVNGKVSEVQSI